MEELVNFMERVPKPQSATCWKNKELQRLFNYYYIELFHHSALLVTTVFLMIRMLPGPLKDAVDVWTWKRSYSMQEVNSALSKVQLVGYSQKVVRPLVLRRLRLTSVIAAGVDFDGVDASCSPGAVWSRAGLPLELGLLTGQLQLDHSVSS